MARRIAAGRVAAATVAAAYYSLCLLRAADAACSDEWVDDDDGASSMNSVYYYSVVSVMLLHYVVLRAFRVIMLFLDTTTFFERSKAPLIGDHLSSSAIISILPNWLSLRSRTEQKYYTERARSYLAFQRARPLISCGSSMMWNSNCLLVGLQ